MKIRLLRLSVQKNQTQEPARLKEGEFDRFMIASDYRMDSPPRTKSQRIGAAIVFAIETAMRAGEICNIEWVDVDLERRTVFLPKNEKW